jgi:hypothetical protein
MNQSWFFEKMSKIDKLLVKLTKTKRKKTQIRDKKEYITTNTKEIKRIIRETLYSNKLETLEEMDSFLDAYNLPKLKRGHMPLQQIYNGMILKQ